MSRHESLVKMLGRNSRQKWSFIRHRQPSRFFSATHDRALAPPPRARFPSARARWTPRATPRRRRRPTAAPSAAATPTTTQSCTSPAVCSVRSTAWARGAHPRRTPARSGTRRSRASAARPSAASAAWLMTPRRSIQRCSARAWATAKGWRCTSRTARGAPSGEERIWSAGAPARLSRLSSGPASNDGTTGSRLVYPPATATTGSTLSLWLTATRCATPPSPSRRARGGTALFPRRRRRRPPDPTAGPGPPSPRPPRRCPRSTPWRRSSRRARTPRVVMIRRTSFRSRG